MSHFITIQKDNIPSDLRDKSHFKNIIWSVNNDYAQKRK